MTNQKHARLIDANQSRVMVSVRTIEHVDFDNQTLITITPTVAEELVHALEAWKDER